MAEFLPFIAAIVVIAVLMAGLAWSARLARRRGTAGAALAGAMAAYDEAFHGTAHDAFVEVQAQAERNAPLFSPDTD
jgi:hypothetical protein